jgi:hypothetical protein
MSVQGPTVRAPTSTGATPLRRTGQTPASPVPASSPRPQPRLQDGFTSSSSSTPRRLDLLGGSTPGASPLLGGESVPATSLPLLLSKPTSNVQPAAVLSLSPVIPPGTTQTEKTVSVPFSVDVREFMQANGRTPTREEALALLNAQLRRLHPKAMEQKWSDPNHPTNDELRQLIKGGAMVINVELAAKSPAGTKEAAEADKDFQKLGAGDRDWLNAEADRQYGQKTQSGTKPTTPQAQEYRDDLRRELTRRLKDVQALPPHLREFLVKDTANFKWDGEAARRVAEKLAGFSPEDLADYLSQTTGFTNDWGELEKSLDTYREHRAQRATTSERVRELQTRLYTPVELYQKYRGYLALEASAGPDSGITAQNLIDAEKELNTQLQAYGYKDVRAFGAAIKEFKQAFLQDTLERGLDRLNQYEHVFVEAQKRYENPGGLYEELDRARQLLAQAQKLREKVQAIESPPNAAKSVPVGDPKKLRDEVRSLEFQAENLLKGLSDKHPILRDPAFAAKLAKATPANFKSTLLAEISQRRSDIQTTRDNLKSNPELVYSMEPLLDASRTAHGMVPGSLFGLILKDHLEDKAKVELATTALKTGVLIGAGLLSGGGGWVGAGFAVGGALFAGYEAQSTWKQYLVDKAAFGAGMTKEEPTMAWAVLATAGAVAELGGVAKALKVFGSMKQAIKGFNESNDIIKLELRLKALPEVTPQLRGRVLDAAKQELKLRQQVEGLVTDGPLPLGKIPDERLGKLTEVAHSLAERGDESFESFLGELRAKNVLQGEPPPETLRQLKEVFEDGVQKARQTRRLTDELARREVIDQLKAPKPTPTGKTPVTPKPVQKSTEAVKPTSVKTPPVKAETPRPVVESAMKKVEELHLKAQDANFDDTVEGLALETKYHDDLLEAFQKSGGDAEVGRLLKTLRQENPSAFLKAFGGTPQGVLLRVASSKDPTLVDYTRRMLDGVRRGVVKDGDLSSALTQAERLAKLPSAGTVRNVTNDSGGVGVFFEGQFQGKPTMFKTDALLDHSFDSDEEVLKALGPYGAPEFRARVRVEDPTTGLWREAIAMEKIDGMDVKRLLEAQARGERLPFPITELHVKALKDLEARLRREGRYLSEVNFGDFILTKDPNRPVVPVDMFVNAGAAENSGLTKDGRRVVDVVQSLVGTPSKP